MKSVAICVLVSCLGFCPQANGQGGIITTIAGGANGNFSGDGGPATSAALLSPAGVAVDASGNLFFVDTGNDRIRKVSASGIITTVAGNGTQGFSGDSGLATSASLNQPVGVAIDGSGNLFIADDYNNRIRKVSASGIITTVAGNGNQGSSGDGGLATSASLYFPGRVAADAAGNLFIANFNQIRKVSTAGIITTVAGNGTEGFSGDGGPATSASILVPSGLAVDASGNLFFADSDNNRIRKVSASGIITTVVGNGPSCPVTACGGFSGDGGPAISASLNQPSDVAVDAAGNLFIVDTGNNRIRKVSTSAIITTVAGGGDSGIGDGGPATSATLGYPFGVAVDRSGNLFIADSNRNRIREVSASTAAISVTNDASFTTSISPGSLVALFGNGNILANSTASGFKTPLPTSSGGTSVTMNGILCPLVYVSPAQINLQAPTALSAGTATVVVNNNGQTFSTTVQVLTAAPGVFTSDYVITAILQDGNGALLDQSNPASPGQTVAMYLTGIGPVTNYPGDGEPAPSGPLAQSTSSYTLTVNGTAAHIDYLGLTPGFAGLGQINFEIPQGTPAGNTIQVVLTIAGTASKTVQISVKATANTPQIQSLTLSPNSVATGGTVTGSVVLSPAAPSGGAVVALSSNSSGASVPASVTVPAGASSATFTVSAGTVSSNQTVTITASYSGSSAQASLTVTPPAAGTGQLNVTNPISFSAGLVVGAPPTALTTYTLTNSGTGALSYTVTGDVPWLSFSPSSGTLAPNASAVVTISTNASASSLAVGTYTTTVTFSSGTTSIMRGGALSIVSPPPAGCQIASAGPYQFRVVNMLSTDALVYFGNVALPSGQTGSLSFGLQMQPNECDIVGLPEIAAYSVDVSRYPNGTAVSNSLTFTDMTSGFLFNGRSAYTVIVTSGTCSAAIDQGMKYLGQSVYSVCVP